MRAQQLINYDERRRQTRRDAYAAFLGHLARIRAPLTECLEDLHRPSPDLQAITDRLERTRLEAAQNDSFSYLVMLEGPEIVSDIATQTMEALDAMNGLIREHCKRLQAGKDTSETEPLIENLGQGIGTYGAAFLAAAREAIKLKSEPVKSKIRDQRITLDL